MTAVRCVELNPARAGMEERPGDYAWPSALPPRQEPDGSAWREHGGGGGGGGLAAFPGPRPRATRARRSRSACAPGGCAAARRSTTALTPSPAEGRVPAPAAGPVASHARGKATDALCPTNTPDAPASSRRSRKQPLSELSHVPSRPSSDPAEPWPTEHDVWYDHTTSVVVVRKTFHLTGADNRR